MKETKSLAADRLRALEALDHLRSLMQSGAEFDRTLNGYMECKATLASWFASLARSDLEQTGGGLEGVRRRLGERMRERFGASLPAVYLTVHGYGGIRDVLYSYLRRHEDSPVPASRLRVLTGDQVHTERRVRELRDLGLVVEAIVAGGENTYVLSSAPIDLDTAACAMARRNILDDKSIGAEARATLLEVVQPAGGPD